MGIWKCGKCGGTCGRPGQGGRENLTCSLEYRLHPFGGQNALRPRQQGIGVGLFDTVTASRDGCRAEFTFDLTKQHGGLSPSGLP